MSERMSIPMQRKPGFFMVVVVPVVGEKRGERRSELENP